MNLESGAEGSRITMQMLTRMVLGSAVRDAT